MSSNKKDMKLLKQIVLISILLISVVVGYSNNKLIAYTAPEGATLNPDFSVKVRNPGSNGCNLPQ
jgi:hypothetical protein